MGAHRDGEPVVSTRRQALPPVVRIAHGVAVFLGTRVGGFAADSPRSARPRGSVVHGRSGARRRGSVREVLPVQGARFGEFAARSSSKRSISDESTSTGVDARLASVLCYAGWWVTGLVFLFAERRNQDVRFHAAQSLIVFGALSAALFLCGGASAVAFIVAVPRFQMLQAVGNALWLGAVVLWLFLRWERGGEKPGGTVAGDLPGRSQPRDVADRR